MYILKVDKNEFTKDGVKKELWGYSLYNGTTCIKSETIKARIRDTDMADAMVRYSKDNILQQAGQSMLAQANTSMEAVLSLLQ